MLVAAVTANHRRGGTKRPGGGSGSAVVAGPGAVCTTYATPVVTVARFFCSLHPGMRGALVVR